MQLRYPPSRAGFSLPFHRAPRQTRTNPSLHPSSCRGPAPSTPQQIAHPSLRSAQNVPILLYSLLMGYVLGFDGGGTKTECVLMDESGAVLARSRSGASNAVNVGAKASAAALAAAGTEALRSAGASPSDVAYILAGISGAGEPNVRAEIQDNLKPCF